VEADGDDEVSCYPWKVKGVAPGEYYQIKIIATDLAGNCTEAVSDCFTIWGEDCSVPLVCLISPPNDACIGGFVEVQADASDEDSGIQKVIFEYSLDGVCWEPIGEDCVAPYCVTWDTCGINSCGVMVKATAVNGVGVCDFDINKCICVDNCPPQRSEERRVGKECSEPCKSTWSPYH
jgi:hypothetical protein